VRVSLHQSDIRGEETHSGARKKRVAALPEGAGGASHRHRAAPTTAMSHIAIPESLDGRAVERLEKVTDEQYGAWPSTRERT
jgi:hypothetical protein